MSSTGHKMPPCPVDLDGVSLWGSCVFLLLLAMTPAGAFYARSADERATGGCSD